MKELIACLTLVVLVAFAGVGRRYDGQQISRVVQGNGL
jgi:hypothetical protein